MRFLLFFVIFTSPLFSADYALAESLREVRNTFDARVVPILEQYCIHCHTQDSPSGNIALDAYQTNEALFSHVRTWAKMSQTQQGKYMPPADEDQPTDQERATLIDWASGLQQGLDSVPPTDPGETVFRRLNRMQYNQTVQDLLYVEFDVATAVGLPDDPTAFGYDNIGAALEIPPLLLEKYVAAADEMLARAIDTKPPTWDYDLAAVEFRLDGEMPEGPGKDGPIPAATEVKEGYRLFRVNAAVDLPIKLAQPGTYRLTFEAWGHKGPKWINWQPQIEIQVNGQTRKSISILSTREEPGTESTSVSLPSGEVALSIRFANAEIGPKWADNDSRFRHLGWKSLTITGPVHPQGIMPQQEAHQKLLFVEPTEALSEEQAAEQILSRFATRAFRRPVSSEELSRVLSLYQLSRDRGAGHGEAIRDSFKLVLLSPSFLFRIEEPVVGSSVTRVSDHELATRMSYFLWGTMPDETLRQLAEQGQLSQPDVLQSQVARMMSDPRSRRFIHDFSRQWLHLEELDHALPSEEFFPDFTAKTRNAMRTEILMFMENLFDENRPVTDLLDADYSFTNRDLTRIYRYGGHQQEFKRAEINKRRMPERGGLLGMGGILAMTSHVARNSPTRRGKWVLDVLYGDPPAPPPADVEQIDESSDKNQARSFRELLSLHADESATCAGCHRRMDPLGFALDQFNPIGRFEKERNGEKVNAQGALPGGVQIDGVVELRAMLLEEKPKFVRNLTEQLMTYALGRELTYRDRPAISRIVDRAKQNDYAAMEIVLGIVQSYPFQHRRHAEYQVADAIAGHENAR